MDAQAITIAVINTKGGVGKTTCCHHLTAPLADLGHRVVLVDMDYQANLSRGLLGASAVDAIPSQRTTAALFDDSLQPSAEDLTHQTTVDGVTLLPAGRQLEDFAYPRPHTLGEYQFVLSTFLDELRDKCDIILLDCRPSVDLLSWNALCAADFVLCPFQPEDYGAQGISRIQEAIDQVVGSANPRLRLLGYLLNRVRNTGLHRTFEALLREYYGDDVLRTVIPDAIVLPEAVTNRLPIGRYKKRVKAAKAFGSLVDEVFERIPRILDAAPRYLYMGNRTQTDMSVSTPETELRKAV